MENKNRKDDPALSAGFEKIRALAGAEKHPLTIPQVLSCFPGLDLTEDQVRGIYAFLGKEGISLAEYEPREVRTVRADGRPLTGEDNEYYQMYMRELRTLTPCGKAERARLLNELTEEAAARLIEGHLHLVPEIAKKHAGRGAHIQDLVQEGNLALMMAVGDYRAPRASVDAEEFLDYLLTRIEEGILAYLEEETASADTGERLAAQANRLFEYTQQKEEELGRPLSLAELSRDMGLSEAEIEEIIRVSMNAMDRGDLSGEPEKDRRSGGNPLEEGWM